MFVNSSATTGINFGTSLVAPMPAGLVSGDWLFATTVWDDPTAVISCATMPTAILLGTRSSFGTTVAWWAIPYAASLSLEWDSTVATYVAIIVLGFTALSGTLSFATITNFSGTSSPPPITFSFAGGTATAGDDQIIMWALDPTNTDVWSYTDATGTPGTFTPVVGSESQYSQAEGQYFNAFTAGGATGSATLIATITPTFLQTDYAGIYISARAAGSGGGGIPVAGISYITA